MFTLSQLQRSTLRAAARAHSRVVGLREERERGDVPGWVLITLMTAGIVGALWAVAQPMLINVFDEAVKAVKGPSK